MKKSSIASHSDAMNELRAERHWELWDRQTGVKTKYADYDMAVLEKINLSMEPGNQYRYQVIPVVGKMP